MGETFFEASKRAIFVALLVKRSFGGCVESVLTFRTQRFLAGDFFADVFFAEVLFKEARREAAEFFAVDFFFTDRVGTGSPFDRSVLFEELHLALVLLRLLHRRECAEVAALAGGSIFPARIKAVLARL